MSTLAYRELYAPAHFGNSYEVMAPYEMREMLREAQCWGFNAYGDWFDAADLKHPDHNPRHEYLLPQATRDQKLSSFQLAAQAGMDIDYLMTPNHVFLDQLAPELLAAPDAEGRMFGQLLCPSNPIAREIIIDNQRAFLRDLHAAGVEVQAIGACPYDYGGCACPACAPWVVTFGKLMVDMHEAAKEFFPQIRVRLVGWWWTEEEHRLFSAWADREQPGRFASLAGHIPYGETHPPDGRQAPAGCERQAFVHIGYGDIGEPRDPYGSWGPSAAPQRLAVTVRALRERGMGGFMAYSEGQSDDVNKALLAGLSSGLFDDPLELLAAYAERYFGARGDDRAAWARWLAHWGSPFTVDIAVLRAEFDRLAVRARGDWRLAQWASRVRLFEAHAAVLARAEWDTERHAAAERFLEERHYLYRDVWKLGLVRHVLNPRFFQPDWYGEYDALGTRNSAPAEA